MTEEQPVFTPAPEDAPPSEEHLVEVPEEEEPAADEDPEPDEDLD